MSQPYLMKPIIFFQASKGLNRSTFTPPSKALYQSVKSHLTKERLRVHLLHSVTPEPPRFGPTPGHALLGSAGTREPAPLTYKPSPPFLSPARAC